jgi:outer membrane protein OmpA-like peptidoglycan-associated protein
MGGRKGALWLFFIIVLGIGSSLGLPAAGEQESECEVADGVSLPPPRVVHFDLDSTAIKAKYRGDLEALARRYAGNPNFRLCLTGQADSRGNKDYNRGLALRRAEAVKAYLVARGLSADVLSTRVRGEVFGDSFLSSLSEDGTNRRVEVKILSR